MKNNFSTDSLGPGPYPAFQRYIVLVYVEKHSHETSQNPQLLSHVVGADLHTVIAQGKQGKLFAITPDFKFYRQH